MKNSIQLTQNILNKYYGLEQKKETSEDYFVFNRRIPLGTKKPFDSYSNGIIPEKDEVYLTIPKNSTDNPLNIAIIEPTGRGKSRMLKNIVKYLHLNDYNNLLLQYKSRQWEFINKPGDGYKYHQNMEIKGIKRSNYIPSYILDYETVLDVKKEYGVFSPDITTFTKDLDWKYLKVSEVATATLAGFISQGIYDLDKLQKQLNIDFNRKKLAPATKTSALRHIENLKNKKIFGYPKIDFEKEWNKKNNILVSFFGQIDNLELNIFKLVEQVIRLGIKEKSTGEVSRKMVIFEDGAEFLKKGNYYSTMALSNIHNISREYGLNSIYTIQDPTETKSAILSGATTKIISNIANPDPIKGLPQQAYRILKDNELREDKETYTFEKLLIQEGEVIRFFPYDCCLYHA